MKSLSEIIQNENLSSSEILAKCSIAVGEYSNICIILLDVNGVILSEALRPDMLPLFPKALVHGHSIKESEPAAFEQIRNLETGIENVKLNFLELRYGEKTLLSEYYGSFLPIKCGGVRAGTIIAYGKGTQIDSNGLWRIDMLSIICSIVLRSVDERKNTELAQIAAVKSAMGTLTYSELEAALHVLRELGGMNGVLVTGKIAEKIGVTHSVVVNSLRKLESAGLVESRSLGMKGTHIKVLSEYFVNEAAKLPM